MIPKLLVIAILLGSFAFDSRLRTGADAKKVERRPEDAGTSMVLAGAYILGLVRITRGPGLSWRGVRVALVPMFAGLGLRVWAMRVLGPYYTRMLRIQDEQVVVRSGPYPLVRHPGYAGMILMWPAGAAASGTVWITVSVIAILLGAYLYQISREESLLTAQVAGYAEYARQTRRLVPWLY